MYPMGPSAYDRAITVFSPDGRLFQVEYAREAVKRGTNAVGIIYDKGVVLAVDKNITSPLIVPESIEKIFLIDKHIGVAASGLVADARRLVDEARIRAQRNRIAYNEPISVFKMTSELCDLEQFYTQYGGARPFGVSLLIAGVDGVDKRHRIFETDPSGAFTEYYAGAIGINKKEIEEIFEKKYKKGLSRDEAIEMALYVLNSVSEGGIKTESIDMVTIEKEYEKISKEEITSVIDSIKKTGKKEK